MRVRIRTVHNHTVEKQTMPMTPLERKAAFASQAILDQRTLVDAAREECGVTFFHLSEGIAGRRTLSDEVKQKFAAYIGKPLSEVFGESADDAAA
jgi:hypothetical protein